MAAVTDCGGRNGPGKGPEVGGLCGSRGPAPASLASGACSSGAGRVAEPGSCLTPHPGPVCPGSGAVPSTANSSPTWKSTGRSRDCGSRTPRRTRPSAASCSSGRRRLAEGSAGLPTRGLPLPFAPSPPGHTHHQPSSPPPAPFAGVFCLCPHQQVCVCVCACTRVHVRTLPSDPAFLLSPRLRVCLCV